jgi:glucose/arabinose dehydrogenase
VPFVQGQPVDKPIDILSGFISQDGHAWGRPVGVAVDAAGRLLVADDVGNTVWQVRVGR